MQKSRTNYRAQSKYLIVICLVIFCPVLVTDFSLSFGLVPISYVIFYSIIWFDPILIIYLILSALYVLVFLGFAKMILENLPNNPKMLFTVSALISLLIITISSRNIYIDINSDTDVRKNIYRLYIDQAKSWEDMQQNIKLRELGKKRLKRLQNNQ